MKIKYLNAKIIEKMNMQDLKIIQGHFAMQL